MQGGSQRWDIVRQAKICRHCIWEKLYSAYLRLESQNLSRNPFPSALPSVQWALYTEHCVKFWDSSLKLAKYIKPKIQRRHLFADLRIPHLWKKCITLGQVCSNGGAFMLSMVRLLRSWWSLRFAVHSLREYRTSLRSVDGIWLTMSQVGHE
jgi:hypothetical protein